VLSAVDHLYSRGIAHNDIKPENILVFSSVFKLADFGLACPYLDPSAGTHGLGAWRYPFP
jgi:serine/threonine protein kinase